MAADAAVVLHQVEPIGLLDLLRDLAVLPAELARRRNLQQRVPIDRRVILRRGRLLRCRPRAQIELLTGLAVHLPGIDEAIAAHPQLVLSLWNIRHDIAALIVGDDTPALPR